ncbi:two-component system sensor histidine kinase NtrB [Planctomycetes bacterium K23_9]|uniref:histidine kinase n=1 Tax=Stieleria marina TaxID=1930275 RepID=A0A517NVI3_9BACT|nr:Sporulation kinase A [Planctomycetes bacterium K23_9]
MNSPAPLPCRGDPIPPEYFRAIAEGTVDWESWISVTGDVLWVNEAVHRFTGYTPAECLKMADYPLPLLVPEDRQCMADHLRDAVSGSTENNIEFRVLHRDGSTPWMAVSWQPIADGKGRSLGFRASVRDVTEKRRLREQLRLQNEHLEQLVQERTAKIARLEQHRLKMEKLAALGELAAGVAHEINNPLAGIRNAFALFKRSLSDSDKHYDKLEMIDAEIERISGITHQMYQLYRPSQQQASRFSIGELIDEVITLSMPIIQKSQVDVVTTCGELQATERLSATEVFLRKGELKQVLLNLVRNAIQASQPGQKVVVTVQTVALTATIYVSDEGHGIDPAVITKIFDPFFSTKAEAIGQGMGLGLSVSHGIIEAMKGTIDVSSVPGESTCFVVRLPRKLAE